MTKIVTRLAGSWKFETRQAGAWDFATRKASTNWVFETKVVDTGLDEGVWILEDGTWDPEGMWLPGAIWKST